MTYPRFTILVHCNGFAGIPAGVEAWSAHLTSWLRIHSGLATSWSEFRFKRGRGDLPFRDEFGHDRDVQLDAIKLARPSLHSGAQVRT